LVDSPFSKNEIDRIQKVIDAASSVLELGNARTATKSLKVLSENIEQIRSVVVERKRQNDGEAFTFTYEEEADPETFFVPYVWEVIVCCATASAIEWTKLEIRVFLLLDDPVSDAPVQLDGDVSRQHPTGDFARDLAEIA
jgi:hypothetical protein